MASTEPGGKLISRWRGGIEWLGMPPLWEPIMGEGIPGLGIFMEAMKWALFGDMEPPIGRGKGAGLGAREMWLGMVGGDWKEDGDGRLVKVVMTPAEVTVEEGWG